MTSPPKHSVSFTFGESRENSFRIHKSNSNPNDEEEIELQDTLLRECEESNLEDGLTDSPEARGRHSLELSGSLAEEGEHVELFQELKQDRKTRKSQEELWWWWNMIKETVTIFLPLGLTRSEER